MPSGRWCWARTRYSRGGTGAGALFGVCRVPWCSGLLPLSLRGVARLRNLPAAMSARCLSCFARVVSAYCLEFAIFVGPAGRGVGWVVTAASIVYGGGRVQWLGAVSYLLLQVHRALGDT